jgi:hypothetical protein
LRGECFTLDSNERYFRPLKRTLLQDSHSLQGSTCDLRVVRLQGTVLKQVLSFTFLLFPLYDTFIFKPRYSCLLNEYGIIKLFSSSLQRRPSTILARPLKITSLQASRGGSLESAPSAVLLGIVLANNHLFISLSPAALLAGDSPAAIGHPDMRAKHYAYGHSVVTLLNPRGVTTVSHKYSLTFERHATVVVAVPSTVHCPANLLLSYK